MMSAKRLFALALAVMLVLPILAGCGNAPAETTAPQKAPAEKASETQEESAPTARMVTDMAGREVELPGEIGMVYASGTATPIYLYSLAPEKLLGWSYDLNNIEKAIILPEYQNLPNFGMKDAVNYEAIIAAGPSIAIVSGTPNAKTISEADDLTQSLGIPVLVVDTDLLQTAAAFRFLGDVLGFPDRGEALAAYCDATFADISAMEIGEEDRVRVYYGNGEGSLETAPAGSSHAQLLDLVRAVNVADLELGDGSRVQISAEQLLAWDPEVILTIGEAKANLSGGSEAANLMANPIFATLQAVQEGKVYGIPNAPFNWVDRPAGPNRIIGVRWLSGLLYPEYLNFDVDEQVKEFFSLFYHVELTDDQLASLYDGTIGME